MTEFKVYQANYDEIVALAVLVDGFPVWIDEWSKADFREENYLGYVRNLIWELMDDPAAWVEWGHTYAQGFTEETAPTVRDEYDAWEQESVVAHGEISDAGITYERDPSALLHDFTAEVL